LSEEKASKTVSNKKTEEKQVVLSPIMISGIKTSSELKSITQKAITEN